MVEPVAAETMQGAGGECLGTKIKMCGPQIRSNSLQISFISVRWLKRTNGRKDNGHSEPTMRFSFARMQKTNVRNNQ